MINNHPVFVKRDQAKGEWSLAAIIITVVLVIIMLILIYVIIRCYFSNRNIKVQVITKAKVNKQDEKEGIEEACSS